MKINENTIVKPLPTESLIKEFETSCEVKLPKEFKEFLLKYNGAKPITYILPFGSNEYVIERFLCLLEDYKNNIAGWYDIEVVISQIFDRLTANKGFGMDIIPIAYMFAGDFICLDYRKEGMDFRENENPSVVIWDHEESEEWNPVTIKIADSITEFFDMLIEDDEE